MTAVSDLRDSVNAALVLAVNENTNANWNVYSSPLESPTPPCFTVQWGDPMLRPLTFCTQMARIEVRCVAPSTEPDSGLEVLERMIEAATVQLGRARLRVMNTSRPGPFSINNARFLSSLLTIEHTVSIT